MKTKQSDSGLISRRKLWLGEGTSAIMAMAELYQSGPAIFDLYLSIGGQVPVRFQGDLALMVNKGQHFVDARKAEGYSEDLPTYTPNPIN